MKLARRIHAVQPSVTLALNARAKALAEQGKDVVSLAAGEPDFNTPDHICEAAHAAIRAGFTKYTATAGTPELRRAICEKMSRDHGLSYKPEQVLVSCGAKHSLFNFFQALIDEGDEVVIFAPYWVSYPEMVRVAQGVPVIVEARAEDGFVPKPEALRAALGPRTRAVVLNSPCNPTGAVISGAALEAVGRVLEEHDCAIVSDDIYEKLLYAGRFESILQKVPSLVDRTVLVNGVSKTYAMTGWRIGYAAGPREIIEGMSRVQDQSTSSPSSISQKAALAALTGPTEPLQKMVAEFDRRRRFLLDGLRALPGVTCPEPLGAFYALPGVHAWLRARYRGEVVGTSMRAAEILLTDFDLALVPGAPFGAEGHLRLSFAASMQALEKGLERMRAFASTLH